MKQKRLASKFAIAATWVFALFGVVISVLQLVSSVRYGIDWYRFIPSVLYLLCFADLVIYSSTGAIQSKYAFLAVLVNYGLVVLFTGVLFPPVFPHGTKFLFMALSIIIVLGLLGFNFMWSRPVASKVFLTFAYVAELAAAFAALSGNPMMLDGDFVAQASLFIRPIILSAMAVCFLTRMYEKKHEKEQ